MPNFGEMKEVLLQAGFHKDFAERNLQLMLKQIETDTPRHRQRWESLGITYKPDGQFLVNELCQKISIFNATDRYETLRFLIGLHCLPTLSTIVEHFRTKSPADISLNVKPIIKTAGIAPEDQANEPEKEAPKPASKPKKEVKK